MTKGMAPKELIAELKRNKSAPDFEEENEDSLPSGSHPLDILQRGRKEKDSLAKSSSLPPKDSSKELMSKQSGGLLSKASGVDFDTLSSAQVTLNSPPLHLNLACDLCLLLSGDFHQVSSLLPSLSLSNMHKKA